jgi:hypothetical protein
MRAALDFIVCVLAVLWAVPGVVRSCWKCAREIDRVECRLIDAIEVDTMRDDADKYCAREGAWLR